MPAEFHDDEARDRLVAAVERALAGPGDDPAGAVLDALQLTALGFSEGVYFVGASVPPP